MRPFYRHALVTILAWQVATALTPIPGKIKSTLQLWSQKEVAQETLSDTLTLESPDDTQQDNDHGFRNMRETLPLWLQHGLRDSGALRLVIDGLTKVSAAPAFYNENPHCFWEFLRISGYPKWMTRATDSTTSVDFSMESYGPHRSQIAEVMVNTAENHRKDLPLLVFIHGGAWGSGFPTMYRLLAAPFLAKKYRVAILGYRTYPDATVQGQIDDIVQAVNYVSANHHGPTVVMGHSSGAHITLLAALQGCFSSVQGLICMSGVYDIEQHYDHESARGVDQISPMAPVCGGTLDNWRLNSPTRLVPTLSDSILKSVCPVFFLHGNADTTVPVKSSEQIHEALAARNQQCQLQILDKVGHSELVLETLLGGKTQDAIFGWLDSELGL